jgi:hypothetical protein
MSRAQDISERSDISGQRSAESGQKLVVGLRIKEVLADGIIGIWILIYGISASGCVSEPVRTYDKSFVNTYAELTLLYEKQKMEKKETDSSYKLIVKEFFDSKGIRQEEFKQRAEELSQQPQVWKFFITDVTAAIDSIKNLN